MKKVIIAEDLAAILERKKSFLDRSDIRLIAATTNEKALEFHRAEKADLIIAHLDTPDISGEMLCSLIREDNELRRVSVVIVCSPTETELERCTRCRANAFFTTPINITALLEDMHQLLHIAPRRSSRISVGIKLQGTSRRKPFFGFGENISISGMLFRTSAVLFEGDTIVCSFSLPGSAHITTDADIVRVHQRESEQDMNLYGVKFKNLGSAAFAAIEAFVK